VLGAANDLAADLLLRDQADSNARSEKTWIVDPQGVPWEAFLTTGESTVYGASARLTTKAAAKASACC